VKNLRYADTGPSYAALPFLTSYTIRCNVKVVLIALAGKFLNSNTNGNLPLYLHGNPDSNSLGHSTKEDFRYLIFQPHLYAVVLEIFRNTP